MKQTQAPELKRLANGGRLILKSMPRSERATEKRTRTAFWTKTAKARNADGNETLRASVVGKKLSGSDVNTDWKLKPGGHGP